MKIAHVMRRLSFGDWGGAEQVSLDGGEFKPLDRQLNRCECRHAFEPR